MIERPVLTGSHLVVNRKSLTLHLSGIQAIIRANGNVGLGTTAPTARLHVAGNGYVTGSLTVDGNIAAKYQDVAEWVPASHALPAGTVVTLDPTKSNHVEASSKAISSSRKKFATKT